LLLPASVGGALANLGLSLAGKVPVNLNFTAGRDSIAAAVERCGIKTILTSRRFLSKAGIEEIGGMVFLEDVMKELSAASKLRMLVAAYLLPAWAINRIYLKEARGDALATVVFSSGSTGVPKGVMLTHRNILANVDSIGQVYDLVADDVLVGVLPFFHSFGFTGTIWLPALSGFGAVYHPNPMDAKAIGELAGRYRATVIISTPTFCSTSIRKCEIEQFKYLRYAIVGARGCERRWRPPSRKNSASTCSRHGCTEMAPVVAVNVPDVETDGGTPAGARAWDRLDIRCRASPSRSSIR
jgi:acyl-[acyl-carrier-protein]-phospholipid O-acyltransferase/long-chain-fatty-acid--[acyl-carrier-protein] ligase